MLVTEGNIIKQINQRVHIKEELLALEGNNCNIKVSGESELEWLRQKFYSDFIEIHQFL